MTVPTLFDEWIAAPGDALFAEWVNAKRNAPSVQLNVWKQSYAQVIVDVALHTEDA